MATETKALFREVTPRVSFPELELGILDFWKQTRAFEKSLELRKGRPRFVFYEGPPTANGLPHIGHVLTRVYKDIVPRYRTMKGYYVPRKAGWDTHGLPVELEVEKELGITTKQQIEEFGVAEFNRRCRESVFRYEKEWRRMTDRIGFWLDMEHPYITLTTDYIESVWWILRRVWDKGLLYQDYKVVPYCPRCGTALSSHEVALGYEETEDPSVYVKMELTDEPGTYLLIWTTTPWTLPGNVAIAVHPEARYARVSQNGQVLILAEALLDQALVGPYEVLSTFPGKELAGRRYKPLFTFRDLDKAAHYVVTADFVTLEDGTGLVHLAPAFGEVDLEVGRKYDLPVVQNVDARGCFTAEVTPWAGLFVKDADPQIIEDLRRRGLLYRATTYRHTYPFCWRCSTPLLYYARNSWYIRMTALRENLLKNNQQINWVPEHVRDGRFGDFLANVVDWALSRERYWGTPLPVWNCQQCRHQHCVGSLAELMQMARPETLQEIVVPEHRGSVDFSRGLPELRKLDLHRPYIDAVVLVCPQCGGEMRRVPYLIDVWFDSGSMPVAQWHYPFDNQEEFKASFPADFISEAMDQTRGWFYTLHAIATLLFDSPAFKNCISLGLVLDEQGRKMSKSLGNVVDPWSVINVHGADAVRWYFYSTSHPGLERRFSVNLVGEVVRRFMLTLWNTYSFWVTYARLDGFDPTRQAMPPGNRSALDRWLLSRLNRLVGEVDTLLEQYDITTAARAIEAFVDELSNWYVRRGRRRYWKSEEDADKVAAYLTLYDALVTLARVIAPFMPFLAEEMYQNLVRSVDRQAPESVHHCDFPLPDSALIDAELESKMAAVQQAVSLGRAARNSSKIKVRQPLSRLIVYAPATVRAGLQELAEHVLDELNVKEMVFTDDPGQFVELNVRARPDLLGPKLGARLPAVVQALRERDPWEVWQAKMAGRPLTVQVAGESLTLLPEELQLELKQRPGFAAAAGEGYIVALDTALTPELMQEGLARELVHTIQSMRKEAGFNIDDRIRTFYLGDGEVAAVMERFGEHIRQETLSVELVQGPAPDGAFVQEHVVNGRKVTLGVQRVQ
jgi:isoleucyl-tRNA synthetase